MLIEGSGLPKLSEELTGRRTVYGAGTFDLWHVGHVDYVSWLEELAGEDGVVIVQVRRDARVASEKGHTPIIREDERAFIVDNTRQVDFTFLGIETPPPEVKPSIYAATLLRPSIIGIGDGWSNEVDLWKRHVPEAQITLAPFPHRQSTSRIIRRIQNF